VAQQFVRCAFFFDFNLPSLRQIEATKLGSFCLAATLFLVLSTFGHAQSLDQEYSWRKYELDSDQLIRTRDQLSACIAGSVSPRDCVGITLSSCTTTMEQCTFAEAFLWDQVGATTYMALKSDRTVSQSLIESQAAWKGFARAECSFVGTIHKNNVPLQRNEFARCTLRVSANRAINLREYSRDRHQ